MRRADTGRGCRSSSSVGGGYFSGRIRCRNDTGSCVSQAGGEREGGREFQGFRDYWGLDSGIGVSYKQLGLGFMGVGAGKGRGERDGWINGF